MRQLASIVGVLVAAGFMAIAAVMNWRYGLSLGRTEDDQLLFAAVGLGVDVTKVLMPFFFWWSLSNRRWIACALSGVALVACISYSLAGIAGYADLARAVTTGSTLAKQEQAEALRKDLKRKQENLDALGILEPTAVLEQKLDALRQDVRWRMSRECTEATAPASRDFTARSRTSGEYLGDFVSLVMAPLCQRSEPPANPARFAPTKSGRFSPVLEQRFSDNKPYLEFCARDALHLNQICRTFTRIWPS